MPLLTTQLRVKEIIVGGWRVISDNSGLATQRDAVILSDGQGKDEDVLVDLSQFRPSACTRSDRWPVGPEDTTETVERRRSAEVAECPQDH